MQNVDGYVRSLTELVEVEGIMTGNSMPIQTGQSDFNHTQMYYLKIATNGWNSTTATCQLQSRNSAKYIRCVKLKFQQDDYKVQVAIVTNWYAEVSAGAAFGMDFENPGSIPVNGYGTQGTLNATTASAFSVSNLTCRFSLPGQYLLSLGGTNTMENGRISVKGTSDGGRVMVNMNNLGCLPKDGIVHVEEGGTLVFSGGSGLGMSGPNVVSQNSSAKLRVHSGGILRKWAHDNSNSTVSKRKRFVTSDGAKLFVDGSGYLTANGSAFVLVFR